MTAAVQTQVKAAPAPIIPTTHSNLLQRTPALVRLKPHGARECACGGTPGLSSECEECRQKRLTGAGGFQAKLSVSQPGDLWEQEADRMAEAVVNGAPSTIKPSAYAGQVMKQATGRPTTGDDVPDSVHETIRAPGRPLEAQTRKFMEDRFAYDFSQVRVHDDRQAAESARQVNALAYTVGREVVFGAEQYAPNTSQGQKLLAHELTHVLQQSVSTPLVQRQQQDTGATQAAPNLLRIYSFGPSGAGRMKTDAGTTIFPPAAPLDTEGFELVQAGTVDQPKLARFGRYFSLDERQRPHPAPVPSCSIRFITEWTPDDGSPQVESEQNSSATYYGPGETLGTSLGERWTFSNDRPGRLYIVYLFYSGLNSLLLGHGVHFVNDPSAPIGATVLPDQVPRSSSGYSPKRDPNTGKNLE